MDDIHLKVRVSDRKTSFSKESKIIRLKTGIKGLDHLIEGGFPEHSFILLTGTCGTGKSIFGMQYLVEGAIRGEPGVYIALQESLEETVMEMRTFGWPIDRLIKEKKLLVIQPELYNFEILLNEIEDAIDKIKAKRLVIDTISIIGQYFENVYKIRKSLINLQGLLKTMGCTSIAISEVDNPDNLSPFGVEEFIADGVIIVHYMLRGHGYIRTMTIRKMRLTNHSTNIHPIAIKRPGGVIIYHEDKI